MFQVSRKLFTLLDNEDNMNATENTMPFRVSVLRTFPNSTRKDNLSISALKPSKRTTAMPSVHQHVQPTCVALLYLMGQTRSANGAEVGLPSGFIGSGVTSEPHNLGGATSLFAARPTIVSAVHRRLKIRPGRRAVRVPLPSPSPPPSVIIVRYCTLPKSLLNGK